MVNLGGCAVSYERGTHVHPGDQSKGYVLVAAVERRLGLPNPKRGPVSNSFRHKICLLLDFQSRICANTLYLENNPGDQSEGHILIAAVERRLGVPSPNFSSSSLYLSSLELSDTKVYEP